MSPLPHRCRVRGCVSKFVIPTFNLSVHRMDGGNLQDVLPYQQALVVINMLSKRRTYYPVYRSWLPWSKTRSKENLLSFPNGRREICGIGPQHDFCLWFHWPTSAGLLAFVRRDPTSRPFPFVAVSSPIAKYK